MAVVVAGDIRCVPVLVLDENVPSVVQNNGEHVVVFGVIDVPAARNNAL